MTKCKNFEQNFSSAIKNLEIPKYCETDPLVENMLSSILKPKIS